MFAWLRLQQGLLPTASPATGLGKVVMLTLRSRGPRPQIVQFLQCCGAPVDLVGGTAGAALGCGYTCVVSALCCGRGVCRGTRAGRAEGARGAAAQVTGAGRMLDVLRSHSAA